jgi:hypothetical protein
MAAPVIAAIPIRLRGPARRNNALLPDSKIGHLDENHFARARLAAADASLEAGDDRQHGRLERRGQAASWRHVMAPGPSPGPGAFPPASQSGSFSAGLGAAASPTATTRPLRDVRYSPNTQSV